MDKINEILERQTIDRQMSMDTPNANRSMAKVIFKNKCLSLCFMFHDIKYHLNSFIFKFLCWLLSSFFTHMRAFRAPKWACNLYSMGAIQIRNGNLFTIKINQLYEENAKQSSFENSYWTNKWNVLEPIKNVYWLWMLAARVS